jgi:hypothetical protein
MFPKYRSHRKILSARSRKFHPEGLTDIRPHLKKFSHTAVWWDLCNPGIRDKFFATPPHPKSLRDPHGITGRFIFRDKAARA